MSDRPSIHDGWTPEPHEEVQPGDPWRDPTPAPTCLLDCDCHFDPELDHGSCDRCTGKSEAERAPSTTPAPLDVERLAQALCASRPPVVEAGDVVDDECRSLARRVAREYAALEGAPHE